MKHRIAAEYGATVQGWIATLTNDGKSTFIETRAADLTPDTAEKFGNELCNYLLCLRDDTNGNLYYVESYNSYNSLEDFYRCIYRGRPYKFNCSLWRRVELKPDAKMYELH